MRLILVRHGNTFNEGDKVVRIGSKEDLPLTEKGIEQAERIGNALKEKGITPDIIYTSNLKRTRSTANKIADKLSLPIDNKIKIDDRLKEIDYGKWAGLSDSEIIEKFGKTTLDEWNKKAIWPINANWKPKESILIYSLRGFCADMLTMNKRKTVLAVTSGGILRYFLKLVPEKFNQFLKEDNLKIKTGHCAVMVLTSLTTMEVKSWNIPPEKL